MLTSTRLVRPPYSYNKPSILAINSSCNQWLWQVHNQSVYRRNELHMYICSLRYICVCTRGIVYELFHTHLTKHHIICHRLPQLIIHFARKVSHHEWWWWWIHFTVSGHLDDYFSIIPYQRNTDHVNLMFLFALLLLVACIPVSCIMSSSETIHFLSFVTLNLFDTSIKILYQSRYIVI